VETQEKGIVPVAHQVTIELPIPYCAILGLPAFDCRAVKKIRHILGITNHASSPPVGERGSRVIPFILVAMSWKGVVVVVAKILHE
jgi:hypothetical protein